MAIDPKAIPSDVASKAKAVVAPSLAAAAPAPVPAAPVASEQSEGHPLTHPLAKLIGLTLQQKAIDHHRSDLTGYTEKAQASDTRAFNAEREKLKNSLTDALPKEMKLEDRQRITGDLLAAIDTKVTSGLEERDKKPETDPAFIMANAYQAAASVLNAGAGKPLAAATLDEDAKLKAEAEKLEKETRIQEMRLAVASLREPDKGLFGAFSALADALDPPTTVTAATLDATVARFMQRASNERPVPLIAATGAELKKQTYALQILAKRAIIETTATDMVVTTAAGITATLPPMFQSLLQRGGDIDISSGEWKKFTDSLGVAASAFGSDAKEILSKVSTTVRSQQRIHNCNELQKMLEDPDSLRYTGRHLTAEEISAMPAGMKAELERVAQGQTLSLAHLAEYLPQDVRDTRTMLTASHAKTAKQNGIHPFTASYHNDSIWAAQGATLDMIQPKMRQYMRADVGSEPTQHYTYESKAQPGTKPGAIFGIIGHRVPSTPGDRSVYQPDGDDYRLPQRHASHDDRAGRDFDRF